jgi:RNA polymerase-binding protein DksA
MTTIDVESFKTRLIEERERTRKAIAYLHEENRGTTEDEARELSGGSDNHLADIATHTYDRELDSTLEESEEAHLSYVEAALKRIDAGTYGICENCGRPIQPARLEAMPWVTLCIDCKRLAERR